MRSDKDPFDGIRQADVEEIAPGMLEAIIASLSAQFAVTDRQVRTVLRAEGGFATIRWTVACTDSIREDTKRTFRDFVVHGLSMVGPGEATPVVTHFIDWAGVMGQLGMTTGRPSAVDPARTSNP
jgi:hypothetical protein